MIVEMEAGVELKACPFCGSSAVMKTQQISTVGTVHGSPLYWIKCTNIKCATSPAAQWDTARAIESWNNRAA